MRFPFGFVLASLLAVSSPSLAQLQIGMNFVRNYALHQYSRNIEQDPAGISFTGLYRFRESKFKVGIDWGVSMYASEDFTKELSQEGFPEAYADVSEENCYMSYQAIGRYDLLGQGFFAPYAELRLGGASFFTERVYHKPFVEDPAVAKPDQLEGFFRWNGSAFQVAGGGGVNFNLDHLGNNRIPLTIDVNLNYVIGSKANYRSITEHPTPTQDNSQMYNSTTNSYAWRVGVLYNFGY